MCGGNHREPDTVTWYRETIQCMEYYDNYLYPYSSDDDSTYIQCMAYSSDDSRFKIQDFIHNLHSVNNCFGRGDIYTM